MVPDINHPLSPEGFHSMGQGVNENNPEYSGSGFGTRNALQNQILLAHGVMDSDSKLIDSDGC